MTVWLAPTLHRGGPRRTWPLRRETSAPARSAVAIGVRGGVPTLQAYLVRSPPAEVLAVWEEAVVDAEPAGRGIGVDLRHPGADAVREELVVPGAVQRVGDVDAPAVAADLDHLRAAGQPVGRRGRVRRPAGDPTQVDRPDLAGVRGIGHVELLELAGAPAGHVEHPVVDGQVDVADQRGDGAEGLQRRG